MKNPIRQTYDWMGKQVHSRYALAWLIFLFFIEASCFLIPVDPLLILFCIQNRSKSWMYATIATLASVAGGVFGYMIGALLWESVGMALVNALISQETFLSLVAKYKLYQNWAVMIGGFTPIPYKAVTLSAGFCKLPILPFIFYSLLSRGARFFLVAGAIWLWGERIKKFIDHYFNYLVVAFTFILLASTSFLR